MRRMTRLGAILLATAVALVSWTPQAHGVGNAEAAKKAAAYVASQAGTATDPGTAADSLLALAAVGDLSLAPQAGQLLGVVNDGASAYAAKSPESAAKLLLAVSALGLDTRNVNGVNLVEAVKAGVRADGSFGTNPGPFASGLGIIALTRVSEPVSAAMLQYLVHLANTDGGFGPAPGHPSDADTTAIAVLGLSTQTDSISARDTTSKAIAWAVAQQQADGSWRGYNPINSTALMAATLQTLSLAQPKAVQYLVGQQLPDGSLPDAGKPNLLATQQGALLLGDTSYLAVRNPALGAAAAAGHSSSPSPTMTASSAPSSTTTPTQAPTATPSATPTAAPAFTDDGNNVLWILLPIVLLALLGGGAYYLFGKPAARREAAAAAKASPAAGNQTPDDVPPSHR